MDVETHQIVRAGMTFPPRSGRVRTNPHIHTGQNRLFCHYLPKSYVQATRDGKIQHVARDSQQFDLTKNFLRSLPCWIKSDNQPKVQIFSSLFILRWLFQHNYSPRRVQKELYKFRHLKLLDHTSAFKPTWTSAQKNGDLNICDKLLRLWLKNKHAGCI